MVRSVLALRRCVCNERVKKKMEQKNRKLKKVQEIDKIKDERRAKILDDGEGSATDAEKEVADRRAIRRCSLEFVVM
uniref:IBB domain-containing protein n=1 Tax=Syphacia muris TaxID=451379 RepID=A0A0N5AQH5_9BILA